jgi:hypothetical protein
LRQTALYLSSYVYANDDPIALVDPSGFGAIGNTCGSISCFFKQEVEPYVTSCIEGGAQGFGVSWWTGEGAVGGVAYGCIASVSATIADRHAPAGVGDVVRLATAGYDAYGVATHTTVTVEQAAVRAACGGTSVTANVVACRVTSGGGCSLAGAVCGISVRR